MTKTIGLSDDAYERLAALKREDESFSDVVRRLTGAHLLGQLVGTMDEATADHYRQVIAERRAREEDAQQERRERLWGER